MLTLQKYVGNVQENLFAGSRLAPLSYEWPISRSELRSLVQVGDLHH